MYYCVKKHLYFFIYEVTECIEEGILEEFLRANRMEVIQMSIFEYDEELHMVTVREEGPEQISELTGESVKIIRG